MICAYETIQSWFYELSDNSPNTFQLNDEGMCFLNSDKGVQLLILAPKLSEQFFINIDLMPVDDYLKSAVFELAMKYNFLQHRTLGGTLAFDTEENQLVLSYVRLIEHTNKNDFQLILTTLTEQAITLRRDFFYNTSLIAKYNKPNTEKNITNSDYMLKV